MGPNNSVYTANGPLAGSGLAFSQEKALISLLSKRPSLDLRPSRSRIQGIQSKTRKGTFEFSSRPYAVSLTEKEICLRKITKKVVSIDNVSGLYSEEFSYNLSRDTG